MLHAYPEFYVKHAQSAIGNVFHQAMNLYNYSIEAFEQMLIKSPEIREFGIGNPHYVAGLSGTELFARILETHRNNGEFIVLPVPPNTLLKTEEYWAGWALAYYQWYCARPFKTILNAVPLKDIILMYHPFHEMSITRFVEEMERRFQERNSVSKLKTMREICGLSQSELANRSGVKLRTIQSYEQNHSNINKAQVNTIARLAYVLDCSIEDLLDDPLWARELIPDGKL
ncbi:MAG: helix-turn-helix domain-containing protein [archaeon]|nr:helix-turn-helix domain-containing protein [archaeon]